MATKRPSFEKRQREQAAKAKAAAKRDRRQARAGDGETPETEHPTPARTHGQQLDMAEVLARVDALQQRLEAGKISYDDFDAQKAALLASLPIE